MSKTFLRGEWRKLAMINYSVDKNCLVPLIPSGTEIDLWNGVCYVSVVGFMFKETRILGLKVPFHTNFEEVNLRFYVRYKEHGSWKRGVVFVKEIVPKPALTFVANTLYKEHYETMPMRHTWETTDDALTVTYAWKKKRWNSIRMITSQQSSIIQPGSEEEFITEHYWGYTKISNNKTSEYEVAHPKWEVYPTKEYHIDIDFEDIYGPEFAFLGKEKPCSVFLAEGSPIQVKFGRTIRVD